MASVQGMGSGVQEGAMEDIAPVLAGALIGRSRQPDNFVVSGTGRTRYFEYYSVPKTKNSI